MEQPDQDIATAEISFTIRDIWVGSRLDHFLTHKLAGSSRSHISGAIKQGIIVVNDEPVKAGYRLKAGDRVSGRLTPLNDERSAPRPQPIDFATIYEDDAIVVIDKPPGLVVHPGSGNPDHTLTNGLMHRYHHLADVGDSQRPGIVHRLDKDTSGVLVVALTRDVHRKLVQAFKQRQVAKVYLALVHGVPAAIHGSIDAPLGRHPVHRQKMAIRPADGRPALSRWRVVEQGRMHSLFEVTIETGRTHQIRVHLASIGHPVVGDRVYGPHRNNDGFPRQMLHAWQIQFNHPLTGQMLSFTAPVPVDFQQALEDVRKC